MKFTVTVATLGVLVASAAHAAPPKRTPELEEKGKTAFNTYCVACHGEKGDGSGPAAVALNPKPRNFTTEAFKNGEKAEQVFKTVSEGLAGTAMAPFGHLAEEERWALAYHVLKLKGPAAPAKKGAKKGK